MLALTFLAVLSVPAVFSAPVPLQDAPILGPVDVSPIPTLELAMADLDWIGNPPLNPYWSDDGRLIYFERKREGSSERDLFAITRAGEVSAVADEDRHRVDARVGHLDSDRSHKVFTRHGDLFLKNLRDGNETQLTRTVALESWPQFLVGDDRIAYRRGDDVFMRDLMTNVEAQLATLSSSEAPAPDEVAEPDVDEPFLVQQQRRLFDIVRRREERTTVSRERRKVLESSDPTRAPEPFHLGSDRRAGRFAFAPTGRFILTSTVPKSSPDGRRDTMPEWVDASGYASSRSVRSLVGTAPRPSASLALLDLTTRETHPIDLSDLPGISDDPLAEIRTQSREAADLWSTRAATSVPDEDGAPAGAGEEPDDEEQRVRGVSVLDLRWSDDGRFASAMLRSVDNKDRWIIVLDTADNDEAADGGAPFSLRVVHHEHDPAWINWPFNEIGFHPDGRHLWFLTEESGFGHLWIAELEGDKALRPLTAGNFEVSDVRFSLDGTTAYFSANKDHPGELAFYGVSSDVDAREPGATVTRITHLGGHNDVFISPDETQLLIRHDAILRPPELYLQRFDAEAEAVRLTESTTAAFDAIEWTVPSIVPVPSSVVDAPIWSRLYLPPPESADLTRDSRGKRAAVIFTHGAGYLQNAHKGWSDYAHEFMFHSVLTRAGYVVLDPDYRASAGYGRDWRTAIYRRMGEPELEDLRDAIDYLVAEHDVDPERVGTYGGSYGGFLTLMALFTEPGLFAAGAALRPVTDWAHYNHWYTANILNTPDEDPLAYLRSSPIEYAEGLAAPLLICHGMLDDNVFFKDTVRLTQRLIELGKTNWNVAMYPIEPHSFREASSWLDEYRRVFSLFEEHLAVPSGEG